MTKEIKLVDYILKKYEKLEDNYEAMGSWFVSFRKGVIGMDNRMKEIDNKGHFRSDDEVGFFFNGIKEIQDTLEATTSDPNYAQKEKQS